MSDFKVGDIVRVRDEALSFYLCEFQRRVKGGRKGVITGFSRSRYGEGMPFVTFPAEGRKKEYKAGQMHKSDLELCE